MDKSIEKKSLKNPMLLSPVIQSILKFLDIRQIKNCRLVSREWSSTGKAALASRSLIHFTTYSPDRRPEDFHSCFLKSVNLFSAFQISGELESECVDDSWTIEELTKFFDRQQKYIKELTLGFGYLYENEEILEKIDMNSWISKSPMVQKDTKFMTKLSIGDFDENLHIPLLLIAHIKDLTLRYCRVTFEEGVKISPVKLSLTNTTFFQDGNKLDRMRINDIVDFCKAKEVSLSCWNIEGRPYYILDLCGNTVLEKLIMNNVEIVNGEISQWVIENLETDFGPCSLNGQMKVKEASLSCADDIDLFTLPNSIQKLILKGVNSHSAITCSQPIFMGNLLAYLHVDDFGGYETDYSYLSHFMNCPQLTHLKLDGRVIKKLKSTWMPKNVKTLALGSSLIFLFEDRYLNIGKLFVKAFNTLYEVTELCDVTIQVDDFVVECFAIMVDRDLVRFLEYQKRYSFGNRLYIGPLQWDGSPYENFFLEKHVDVKSSFYVFENGEKGRALSLKTFFDLWDNRKLGICPTFPPSGLVLI